MQHLKMAEVFVSVSHNHNKSIARNVQNGSEKM